MTLITSGIHHVSFIIDDEDYEKIKHMNWHPSYRKDGSLCAIVSSKRSSNGKRNVYLHRFIIGVSNEFVIDHKDGNPANNKKENLRICTQSENMKNCRRPITNTSGYKGVSFYPQLKRPWRSCIRVNGKTKHLGCFTTAKEAFEAYKNAAVKEYGEFARVEQ